jgi:hypothetical protein
MSRAAARGRRSAVVLDGVAFERIANDFEASLARFIENTDDPTELDLLRRLRFQYLMDEKKR